MSAVTVHSKKPCRRTDIKARTRYSLYKLDLRLDFHNACGYCGTSDFYSGGKSGFHIDHFAPKSKFAGLRETYSNLVYSCPICNLGKSDDWPTDDPAKSYVENTGYIDPCSIDYDKHLARDSEGKIIYLTPLGEYIYTKMQLYLRRRQVCWLLDKMELQLKLLDEILRANPDDLERLKAFRVLTSQYLEYTGFLKRE